MSVGVSRGDILAVCNFRLIGYDKCANANGNVAIRPGTFYFPFPSLSSPMVRPTLVRILLGAAAAVAVANTARAATYYVSNQGNDQNEGRSPQAAWASLARVSRASLQPGDKVLFHRGHVWRGQLVPQSGDETSRITYAAYAEGEKPLLLGSISKSKPEDWTDEGNSIWSAGGLPIDVGNIIFGNEETCGVKKWRRSDLRQDNDYWYDRVTHKVKLRSAVNPARRYARIECAMDRHGIDESGRHYVTYEGLAVKYAAAHGIGGGATHHITVRNCDIGFIGGGALRRYKETTPERYGNGIEFWSKAHDNLVEGCRLWEIFDAALTNQSHPLIKGGRGPGTPQYNLTYRNNVIWNAEYSWEYWNRPENSETHDVYFVHNTCINAGHGWGHSQRPDPSGRQLCFYSSPARARNIVIRDNIFCEAKANAFCAPSWSRAQIEALVMDHNCWYQAKGKMILFKDASYAMADFAKYQADWHKEPHSICALPKFMDAEHHDFRLAPGSRCAGMGSQ